jgi:hypothetical protein
VVVEVRFPDGEGRLFWPGDLEEAASPATLVASCPVLAGRPSVSEEELLFPVFEYHLDEPDPDVVVLRRQGGAFVAAFSAKGLTPEGIVEAAKEDYRELPTSAATLRSSTAKAVEANTRAVLLIPIPPLLWGGGKKGVRPPPRYVTGRAYRSSTGGRIPHMADLSLAHIG